MLQTCDLSDALPAHMSKLLEAASGRAEHAYFDWQEHDYAGIVKHLLASPLLLLVEPAEDEALASTDADRRAMVGSVGEALFAEQPDVRVLDLIKRFAKQEQQSADSGLPRPVALLLYYLAIAAARTRTEQRITRLSDDEMAEGIRWILRQSWIDDRARRVLAAALDQIHPA